MILFYGCEGSGFDKHMSECDNLCISAGTLWNGKKFKNWFPPKYQRLFLDSGGFSLMSKFNKYPFSIKDYVCLGRELKPDYMAVMDYPCEPEVMRGPGEDNYDRIDNTISNALHCQSYTDIPWVMVVQGYTTDEYQYCIRQIKDWKLETPLIAIGSLCIRTRIEDTRRILKMVHSAFPGHDLHGFGLDLRFLKDTKIRAMMFSTDTHAWAFYDYEHDGRKTFLPPTQFAKSEALTSYKQKVDRLVRSPTTLERWSE